MKETLLITVITAGVLFSAVSRANMTSMSLGSDGDGAVVCPIYTWSGSASEVSASITADQYWQPGRIVGSIQANSDVTDPSLTLGSYINNDTSFVWTGYNVNVYMNTAFTISGAAVSLPGDWSTATTQPVWTGTQYEGQLLFSAGTPVGIGQELDFAYTISFSGATTYSFTQEMSPVPEPGTLAFLAASTLLLGGILPGRHRTKHA